MFDIPDLVLDPVSQRITVEDADPTVSVLWDQAVQQAVVETAPGPTIASRAYALTHTAIYDAFASYDPIATAVSVGDTLQRPDTENTDANKTAAMSWAAYTMLLDLFPQSQAIFDETMTALGLDPATAPAEGTPEALGVAVANALIAARAEDGANQANGYADTTGYTPFNPNPFEINDIARWTPENLPLDPEDADPEQRFLTPHWGEVEPFALEDGASLRPPAPEPFFVEGVEASLDLDAATLTLADGTILPVTRDLIGTVINPAFITQTQEVLDFSAGLTDRQKLIAEFWEDGGGTAFPPGTWMTFGQFVSARDDHSLDQDAKLFFALANAQMDAGIATWESKTFYDYARPVRVVRDLGELGLIGTEGTDELTGQNGFVVEAWAGPGEGTKTILAENFLTYQTPDADPSPPFAEHTSGHSAFSAAGAAVLRLFTGSDVFDASVSFEAGQSRFEPGQTPAEALTLGWDSFTLAADEGGISRLYGGIHFENGDVAGRDLGQAAGEAAVLRALSFIAGGAEIGEGDTLENGAAVLVARYYEAVLGRLPDREGLNFWTALAEDFGAETLATAFLVSQEFEAREGSPDPEALLAALFDNLDLDPAESSLGEALEARLDSGEAASLVVADFTRSDEAVEATPFLGALTESEDGFWFL
ncbi:MAG: DUF6851 domain-containing protein [Pseudomonadota bacterium]